MGSKHKILIIGGGLAGLTSALHLNKLGMEVTLIEKHGYPRHKVCGEYVSNEVLPYFNWLGIDFQVLSPSNLDTLRYTTVSGRYFDCELPLGGFGLSRYAMDDLLYRELLKRNVEVVIDVVKEVNYNRDVFSITTGSGNIYNAELVIGAFGKLSALSRTKGKTLRMEKSPSVAVKAHYSYEGTFPPGQVSLHNFSGGYCGVSMVEKEKLNICYLADYSTFKKNGGIINFQGSVLSKNKYLKEILDRSQLIGEGPISVGQLSFGSKSAVQDHMLMVGDTAGLIHPLCGNGMAMAVNSAKISSELAIAFLRDGLISREEMEIQYNQEWKNAFKGRMWAGKLLSNLAQNTALQGFAMETIARFPAMIRKVIAMTHGKPIRLTSL